MICDYKLGSGVPRFLGLPTEESSQTPFQVIKYMVNHCLTVFNLKVGKNLNFKSAKENYQTSCVLNMVALGVIFSGDKIEEIYDRLTHTIDIPFSVELDEGPVSITVANLFTGVVLRELQSQTDETDDWYKNQSRLCMPHAQKFSDETIPLGTPPQEVLERMNSVNYDFNKKTFDLLIEDFEKRKDELNVSTSFVYYISMIKPHGEQRFANTHYHAFLIEQFYNEEKKEPYYRFYQSWIDKMMLQARTFDHAQIVQFVEDLKTFCQPKFSDEAGEAGLRCFGPSCEYRPKIIQFDTKSLRLTGLSVRYMVDKVNPGQSVNNFLQILSQCTDRLQTF